MTEPLSVDKTVQASTHHDQTTFGHRHAVMFQLSRPRDRQRLPAAIHDADALQTRAAAHPDAAADVRTHRIPTVPRGRRQRSQAAPPAIHREDMAQQFAVSEAQEGCLDVAGHFQRAGS